MRGLWMRSGRILRTGSALYGVSFDLRVFENGNTPLGKVFDLKFLEKCFRR